MERSYSDSLAGLVLAGGYSTRFGSEDKALAELGGTTLLEHVVDRLSRVVDGALISCREDQVAQFRRTLRDADANVGVAPDPIPDRGPAAGIAAGLRPCRAPYAAVVACDTPLVDPAFVSFLADRARGHDGAVPRVDGRLRSTLAVYRTASVRDACEAAVAEGDGSLRTAIGQLDPIVVQEDTVERRTDPASLLDVNTPEDLELAAELYGE